MLLEVFSCNFSSYPIIYTAGMGAYLLFACNQKTGIINLVCVLLLDITRYKHYI